MYHVGSNCMETITRYPHLMDGKERCG